VIKLYCRKRLVNTTKVNKLSGVRYNVCDTKIRLLFSPVKTWWLRNSRLLHASVAVQEIAMGKESWR